MTIALLALGIALLAGGGDALVRGAVGVARGLRVPPLIVGLTLVAFGTSTPELVTALTAALEEAPGIAVGNVVGASIANLLLILGLAAVMATVVVPRAAWRRDAPTLAAAALAALGAALWGSLDRPLGLLFVLALAAYVGWLALAGAPGGDEGMERQAREAAQATPAPPLLVSLLLLAGGVALTVLGARLLVGAAVALAQGLGVSDAVIGLTVVALGTTLPELAASVIAARRGHAEVAWGNVVGSNLFNVLGILGLTAVVHPVPVPAEIARLDVWVLLGATLLVALLARSGHGLGRREGAVLLACYAGYVGVLAAVA